MSLLTQHHTLMANVALPIDPSLIAYWPFDSASIAWGDTGSEIKDLSGNGHHGAAYGAMTSGNVVTGRVGDGALTVASTPMATFDFGT